MFCGGSVTTEAFWEMGIWLEAEGPSQARSEGFSGVLEHQAHQAATQFTSGGPPHMSSRKAGPTSDYLFNPQSQCEVSASDMCPEQMTKPVIILEDRLFGRRRQGNRTQREGSEFAQRQHATYQNQHPAPSRKFLPLTFPDCTWNTAKSFCTAPFSRH